MRGTLAPDAVSLESMRLFAAVADARSFTRAAESLGVPKQTLSRRVAELERALGVRLMHRTTRSLRLTDEGAAYAARCSEIVRLAREANAALTDAHEAPQGTLRVTADPTLGEAFLSGVVIEYARRFPEVRVEVVLTRRRVDLLEEGFDVALRVGQVDDARLSGVALAPARVRYCASPAYVAARGAPRRPEDLARHECLLLGPEGAITRWPVRTKEGLTMLPVSGRLSFSSFAMARDAALAGLGIAIFPEPACEADLRSGALVPVLDEVAIEVGSIWLLHVARRFLPARVRAFVDLARGSFAETPPRRAPQRRSKRRTR